jgi:NitT/TauT family transport system substrate-binding protein
VSRRSTSSSRPLAGLVWALAASVLACSPGPGGAGGSGVSPAPAAATGSGDAGSQAVPLIKARSAYTTTAATSNAWWLAVDGGYFREQGLDVELTHIDAGAALLAAMHNGELDVTGGGGPTMIVGYLQGLETMIIGVNTDTLEGSVFVRPEIQTVEDLRGKTIGVNRLKAITDVGARLALQRLGLQPDVDFFTRGTGGQAEALAAMETGATDGASLNVPLLFEARKRGFREPVNITDLHVPFIGAGISATKRVLGERPELGDRYLRALAQAKSRLRTDREFAIQVLRKYTTVDDPEVLGTTVDYYRPLYVVDSYPTREAVQAVLDAEENPAARTTRPEDVVDYRFAERLRDSGFLDRLPR